MNLNHVRLLVNDVDRSFAFYRDALQMEILRAPQDGYAKLKCGETTLQLFDRVMFEESLSIYKTPNTGGLTILQFEVDDVQQDFARALSAGAQMVKSPRRTKWDTLSGFIRDPDGIIVELFRYLHKDPESS